MWNMKKHCNASPILFSSPESDLSFPQIWKPLILKWDIHYIGYITLKEGVIYSKLLEGGKNIKIIIL